MAHPLERERHEIGPPPTANVRLEIKDAIFADMTTADLLAELLRLPAEERAKIAAELLKSLDGEPEEGVEEAWDAEIKRRTAEVRAGTASTISLEEHEALMDQKWAARAKR